MAYRIDGDFQNGTWTYLRALAYARPGIDRSDAHISLEERSFSIAISREAAIDASAVAQAVGKKLGWKVWDHELLVAVAEKMHARVSDLTPVDETHVSWLQESIESLLDMHAVTQVAYVHHLVQALEALSEQGECVIVGRGAAHILPVEATLRVRLVAPLEQRVADQMRLSGDASRQEVLRMIEHTDHGRRRFAMDNFHRDAADPANYDLVLNMARLSIDDCATQIVDALRAEEQTRAHRYRLRAAPAVWASS